MEHLDGAAGDAVGLAELQRARLLIDDTGLDAGERRQLRGEREPGRAAADDQDIDFCRNRALRARARKPLRRVGDFGVTRLEAIEMKLHTRRTSRSWLKPKTGSESLDVVKPGKWKMVGLYGNMISHRHIVNPP